MSSKVEQLFNYLTNILYSPGKTSILTFSLKRLKYDLNIGKFDEHLLKNSEVIKLLEEIENRKNDINNNLTEKSTNSDNFYGGNTTTIAISIEEFEKNYKSGWFEEKKREFNPIKNPSDYFKKQHEDLIAPVDNDVADNDIDISTRTNIKNFNANEPYPNFSTYIHKRRGARKSSEYVKENTLQQQIKTTNNYKHEF